jgi:hypothetical protein
MATARDLAHLLLDRAIEDEAAAQAMLPIESVTDAIVARYETGLPGTVERQTALQLASTAIAWARSEIRDRESM